VKAKNIASTRKARTLFMGAVNRDSARSDQ